ncbi:hypothetical protein AVEN_140986-1 [Araneus ventricosus]|uniref:Uncharacterized protein n=1 Tax=Araneus ventricosus TaxID=182803 RepID=A0A4Y2SJP9_ARAVE|nr:hypothetical protein AVEN_140986-1 [Araneus ventricosus]
MDNHYPRMIPNFRDLQSPEVHELRGPEAIPRGWLRPKSDWSGLSNHFSTFLFTPSGGVDEVVKPLCLFPLHWIICALVDQQLTFRMVTSYSGKLLEFRHHRPIQESPKGTANVRADSDLFIDIVAALCVKSFLRPPR